MDKRDCTVIVPTRCGADLLPLPLAHLEVQTFPSARFEVIVVDYGDASQPMDLLDRYSMGAPVRTRCLSLPCSTAARACNLAAASAQGEWLLFLDEDLLAGPELVNDHVSAQKEHGGRQVRGRIFMHPQVDQHLLTKRFGACLSHGNSKDSTPLQAFGAHNLSVPKKDFLDSGGFDESLDFDGLQDLALAWKLWDRGLENLDPPHAAAYSWRAIRPAEERRRQYLNGYSLYALFKGDIPEEIRSHFPLERTPAQSCLDRLLQPAYRHLCISLAEGTLPFDRMFERVLCYDFRQGYRDALAGNPPTFARVSEREKIQTG
jgi:hypothetical protein